MAVVDTAAGRVTYSHYYGVGPVRYMTISVHGADHFGTTTSVHIGLQLLYTERTLYAPFRYIHFGTFSE